MKINKKGIFSILVLLNSVPVSAMLAEFEDMDEASIAKGKLNTKKEILLKIKNKENLNKKIWFKVCTRNKQVCTNITPIAFAIKTNDTNLLKLLLFNGANPNFNITQQIKSPNNSNYNLENAIKFAQNFNLVQIEKILEEFKDIRIKRIMILLNQVIPKLPKDTIEEIAKLAI